MSTSARELQPGSSHVGGGGRFNAKQLAKLNTTRQILGRRHFRGKVQDDGFQNGIHLLFCCLEVRGNYALIAYLTTSIHVTRDVTSLFLRYTLLRGRNAQNMSENFSIRECAYTSKRWLSFGAFISAAN